MEMDLRVVVFRCVANSKGGWAVFDKDLGMFEKTKKKLETM